MTLLDLQRKLSKIFPGVRDIQCFRWHTKQSDPLQGPDMCVAYGVTVDDGGASESGDDPFNVTEHRDSESDSDDPFNSDPTSSASDDKSNTD